MAQCDRLNGLSSAFESTIHVNMSSYRIVVLVWGTRTGWHEATRRTIRLHTTDVASRTPTVDRATVQLEVCGATRRHAGVWRWSNREETAPGWRTTRAAVRPTLDRPAAATDADAPAAARPNSRRAWAKFRPTSFLVTFTVANVVKAGWSPNCCGDVGDKLATSATSLRQVTGKLISWKLALYGLMQASGVQWLSP